MKNRFLSIVIVLSFITLVVFINSCQKNQFTTDPNDKLEFSSDTVHFDTVFTSIGSATNFFVVKNTNLSQPIVIDRIFVAKQSNSKYRLNIDGQSINSIENVELPPGDSIYIFVEVTIDPNQDEMIEQDSIIFISNGNVQDVDLISYGQDVTLINSEYLLNDTTWTAAKPVLIYNSALVESDVTLTVEAGTNVYFHKGSSLFVTGTLIVNGQVGNRVTFTTDRLEDYYSETAGQWGAFRQDDNGNTTAIYGGIHLVSGSKNSIISNADIKNGIIGLQVDSCVTPGIPTVKLTNVNIENSKIAGLYALGANIEAENCVFANSGQYNVACVIGGNYSFIHCTMANYWVGNRQTPQVILNNYYDYLDDNDNVQRSYRDLENAYFGNCIIYGSKEDEIGFDFDFEEKNSANFRFENCLLKLSDSDTYEAPDLFVDNIYNESPNFIETVSPYDYHLDTLSPAKDAGKLLIGQEVDLDQDGNSRIVDSKPDIGAFERQE